MAIVLEEQKKFNWKAALTVILILAAMGGALYFFRGEFFAVEEVILPAVKSPATEISGLKFQPDLDNLIKELPPQGKFKLYIGQPVVGRLGRENPFIKF
ncbi:MAG: hypothetical protein HZB99_04835 [Candidatus Harrisonbacteria bacterium]|nr:hypothetical protein [Candidatus Harrisonbacteria bacterium]